MSQLQPKIILISVILLFINLTAFSQTNAAQQYKKKYDEPYEVSLKNTNSLEEKIAEGDTSITTKYELLQSYKATAFASKSLNLTFTALFYYQKAERLSVDFLDSSFFEVAILYENIATVYGTLGDFRTSEAYFQKALKNINKKYGSTNFYYISCSIEYIRLLYNYQQQEKALDWTKKTIEIAKKTPKNRTYNLSTLYLLASTITNSHADKNTALTYSKQGLSFAENPKDSVKLLLHQIYALALNSEVEKAKKLSSETYQIIINRITNEDSQSNLKVDFFINNRNILLFQKDTLAAAKALHLALINKINGFNDKELTASPNINKLEIPDKTFEILSFKFQGLKYLYQKTGDEIYIESLIDYVNLIADLTHFSRNTQTSREMKVFLVNEATNIYKEAALIIAEAGNKHNKKLWIEQAFMFTEYARSVLLNDRLVSFQAIFENENTKQQLLLEEEVFRLQRKLSKANDSMKKIISEEIAQTKADLNNYIETGSNFNVTSSNKVALIKYQERLRFNEIILSYSIINNQILSFKINNESIDYQTITIDSLNYKINEFRNVLTNINSDIADFESQAYYLYNRLLSVFLTKSLAEKLIILPDGILYYLPFEVLITSPQNDFSYTNMPYLVKKFTVSYANSLEARMRKTKLNNKITNQLLAYAPIYEQTGIKNADTTIDKNLAFVVREGFFELKGARTEVEKIKTIWDGKLIMAKAANKQSFFDNAADYRILHLAMHALPDNENPAFSKLIFSQENTKNKTNFLYNYELFGKQLNAELVILSACNTGNGKLLNGEGLISFSRGFAYAGVPSVLQSLWKVNDTSTAQIMVDFHQYLKIGYDKDEALRFAKTDYLAQSKEQLNHPMYWAGFTIVGNVEPIQTVQNGNIFWILSILVIIILVYLVYRQI